MFYTYILLSSKFHRFYFGYTSNLKERLKQHNEGINKATKGGEPWKLTWYAAFSSEKEARNFEQYLKTGSGKSFAYKRFIPVALEKDFLAGRKSVTKLK